MSSTHLNISSPSHFFLFLPQDTIWDVVDTVKEALGDLRSQTQNFESSVVVLEGKNEMLKFNTIQHGLVYCTMYYNGARQACIAEYMSIVHFLII